MDLSLTEASLLLGKSQRQVRYLIQQGKLKARKEGERWLVDRDALPLGPGTRDAQERKARDLQEAVTEALGPHLTAARKSRYTVETVAAFRAVRPLHAAAFAVLGAGHPAVLALERATVAISQGCHRFHARDKQEAWSAAREECAKTLALLLLDTNPELHALALRVEEEVLPVLGGLIRRSERRGA